MVKYSFSAASQKYYVNLCFSKMFRLISHGEKPRFSIHPPGITNFEAPQLDLLDRSCGTLALYGVYSMIGMQATGNTTGRRNVTFFLVATVQMKK